MASQPVRIGHVSLSGSASDKYLFNVALNTESDTLIRILHFRFAKRHILKMGDVLTCESDTKIRMCRLQ